MKVFIVCLLFISELLAEATDTNQKFTALCTEKASTGFVWRNGRWKQVNFKTGNYIVKKMKTTDCEANSENRRSIVKWDDSSRVNILKGCYNTRNHGSNFISIDTKSCFESWEKVNNKFELKSIECDNIAFIPNGNFLMSHIYPSGNNLSDNPRNDYKDSMHVSYGKCSIID